MPRRRVEPGANAGDRRQGDGAQATGRGKGAWWIQAVGGDGAVADLGGSQVPDGYGVLGVVIGSLDGASPSAPRDEASIRGGVDEVY